MNMNCKQNWQMLNQINVKRILEVINATCAVAKRKPEKIRLAGIRTLTSAIPVQFLGLRHRSIENCSRAGNWLLHFSKCTWNSSPISSSQLNFVRHKSCYIFFPTNKMRYYSQGSKTDDMVDSIPLRVSGWNQTCLIRSPTGHQELSQLDNNHRLVPTI